LEAGQPQRVVHVLPEAVVLVGVSSKVYALFYPQVIPRTTTLPSRRGPQAIGEPFAIDRNYIKKTDNMSDIRFGTDGWRAIIADDYTLDNVIRVAEATATFMEERAMQKAVIGYDCRFGGRMFAEATARVLGSHQIEVVLGDHVATTPMVSLAVKQLGADMGIVITASHNPPSYNGYKLKSAYGGPSVPDDIAAVE